MSIRGEGTTEGDAATGTAFMSSNSWWPKTCVVTGGSYLLLSTTRARWSESPPSDFKLGMQDVKTQQR